MNSGSYIYSMLPFCSGSPTMVGCRWEILTWRHAWRTPLHLLHYSLLYRDEQATSSAGCPFFVPFTFANWITPATTEAECVAAEKGRYGCRLYGSKSFPFDNILWIEDEKQCEIAGVMGWGEWDGERWWGESGRWWRGECEMMLGREAGGERKWELGKRVQNYLFTYVHLPVM